MALSVFWTVYFLWAVYRFIRDFHETTQDPYLLFWDILFLCIGLFVVIGHWGQYLAAKKKKSENETPKE